MKICKIKKLMTVGLSSILISSMIVGCSSSGGDQSSDSSSGEGKYGGVVNIALSSVAKNIDPIKYTGVYESDIICNVADTLVGYNKDLTEVVPSLATEWSASEDGTEYIFKLRDDVYFQPGEFQEGRQMKADDVKYSLERSAKESALNRLGSLESVEVLGDFEVKCKLKGQDSSFLTLLTDSGNSIIPKEEVEGQGDRFNTNLIGTGPFKIVEFKNDSHVKLERNDKYWGEKPYLDGVTFKFITDTNMMVNALRTGEIQIASELSGEGIEIVKKTDNLELIQESGMHVAYIYFNNVKGPTKDIKVREALIKAIDVEQLVNGIYQNGEAERAYLPIPPGSWGYDKGLESLIPTFNPEEAKELLAEAGYADGFKTELYISNTPARLKMATIVQQMLKENLNVDVDIKVQEWGTFSEIGSSGNADMYGMSWTWYPDPFFFLNKMFHSSEIGALGNGQGFNNPEVDKLLDEALQITDQEERAVKYKEATKLIVEELPALWYANENVIYGMSSSVKGFIPRADKKKQFVSSDTNVYLEK